MALKGETWIRLELKTARSVSVEDHAGNRYVVRTIRTSEPKFRGPMIWSGQAIQLWAFHIRRIARRDRRWTVEVLADGQQDWRDDWRNAFAVDVMADRDAARERAVQVALAIEDDRFELD